MGFDADGLPGRILQARMHYGMREQRVVSQVECAGMAGFTGPAWSAWEGGRNEPDLRTIETIARVLGIRFAWLACNDGPMLHTGEFPDVPSRYTRGKMLQPEDDASPVRPGKHRRVRGS